MTFYRHNVIISFQKQEHGFLCFKLQYYYNILTIRDAWFSIALKDHVPAVVTTSCGKGALFRYFL